MSRILEDMAITSEITASTRSGPKLVERLGGKVTLERVHKIFYDKIYAHPWMKLYFEGIRQDLIEAQQTDFMMMLFGGPKTYSGRMPIDAHQHIFITEELFQVRRGLLEVSLQEAGIPQKEREDWLSIDAAFQKALIKTRPEDCQARYLDQGILNFKNPLSGPGV
jgi:hemoglobin